MGRGIKLSDNEFDQLDHLRFSTGSADVFRNCLIILMSDAGDTIASIAERVGCTTFTVKRVRRLYRAGGIDALRPIKPPGRPSRATAEFLAAMKKAVGTNPLDLGYGFSTWSAARLAAHLAKVTGIRFSDDQMRRLLHQEGYSGSSSQAHHEGEAQRGCLRKGEEATAAVKKKALKKDAPEALVFQDEVEIHRHPTLSRMWGPVGKQPEVPAPGQNEKKVVYGGVDYATGKITYTIADSKSGMNFLIFLVALVKSYAGRKIRLVCDNGRFHHTRQFRNGSRPIPIGSQSTGCHRTARV